VRRQTEHKLLRTRAFLDTVIEKHAVDGDGQGRQGHKCILLNRAGEAS